MLLRHLTASLALALAGALGLAGCSGDEPDPGPGAESSSAASTSPSPTGPVAPVLPELAKRHDEVGAKAFVKYWFAAVTYAMQTGDTGPFMAVSAEECKTCAGIRAKVNRVYREGGRIQGGGWTPEGLRFDGAYGSGDRLYVFVEQAKQVLHDEDGAEVSKTARTGFGAEILVVWDGAWVVRELAKL